MLLTGDERKNFGAAFAHLSLKSARITGVANVAIEILSDDPDPNVTRETFHEMFLAKVIPMALSNMHDRCVVLLSEIKETMANMSQIELQNDCDSLRNSGKPKIKDGLKVPKF